MSGPWLISFKSAYSITRASQEPKLSALAIPYSPRAQAQKRLRGLRLDSFHADDTRRVDVYWWNHGLCSERQSERKEDRRLCTHYLRHLFSWGWYYITQEAQGYKYNLLLCTFIKYRVFISFEPVTIHASRVYPHSFSWNVFVSYIRAPILQHAKIRRVRALYFASSFQSNINTTTTILLAHVSSLRLPSHAA